MARAFPAVDIRSELQRAALWVQANPTNRKTPRGVRAFLAKWLGRAPDRAPARGGAAGPAQGQFASARGRGLEALEGLKHGG